MKWYLMLPVFTILLFVYMFLQAVIYKTRHESVPTKSGYRFLHISDIHIGLLFISPQRIKRTIQKTNPDGILLGGDLLIKPADLNKLIRWLERIDITVPVYAVAGNHEHHCFKANPSFKQQFLREMRRLNIRFLFNETAAFPPCQSQNPEHRQMVLVGLDDCKKGLPVNHALFSSLREKYSCVLAFSHNPDISLLLPENSVDVLITGHFHGGQIRLPFHLEYALLRNEQLCKMGHRKGSALIRHNRVYISRGLGTVLFPFRFFSVPEVTVFDV